MKKIYMLFLSIIIFIAKRKYAAIFTIIIFTANIFAMTEEELYTSMKDYLSKNFPKEYRASIVGDIVSKQIATIPVGKYTKTAQDVRLIFSFKQGENPTLTLENVDSFYRNMFSIFENVLETTGFYNVVGKNKTYDSFKKAYNITSIIDKGAKIEAIATAKGEDKDYSVLYTIDKSTFLIEKAVYYFKKTIRYNIDITYRNEGKYTVADTIKFVGDSGAVNSFILFKDIKIIK